jgi:putative flippase GtrA
MPNGTLAGKAVVAVSLRSWVQNRPEGIRQFLKFAVVGGLSTVLDIGSNLLIWHLLPVVPFAMAHACLRLLSVVPGLSPDLHGLAADMNIAISSGIVGTANAFYWNQRWTFRAAGHGTAMRQVRRFLVVSYTGMAIRAAMVYGLVQAFTAGKSPTTMQNLVYNCITVVIVMFWNFFLNRAWTFKKSAEAAS